MTKRQLLALAAKLRSVWLYTAAEDMAALANGATSNEQRLELARVEASRFFRTGELEAASLVWQAVNAADKAARR